MLALGSRANDVVSSTRKGAAALAAIANLSTIKCVDWSNFSQSNSILFSYIAEARSSREIQERCSPGSWRVNMDDLLIVVFHEFPPY